MMPVVEMHGSLIVICDYGKVTNMPNITDKTREEWRENHQ